MNPAMQKLVKEHLRLRKELGADHPSTVAALKRTAEFRWTCPHTETKPITGGGRMCANCNLPEAQIRRPAP